MKEYVLIVAGGKGLRMGSEIPKQFIPIGGKPVLMRTMEAFHAYSPDMEIVLVLPASQQGFWKDLCREQGFCLPHRVADGGETRFHSVKNGLACIPDGCDGLVGVHDGVRPFVTREVIAACYETAARMDAAVPVADVVDTVRRVNAGGGSETVPRERYKLVQTPQVFRVNLLKEAYARPYMPCFTDDASVVEAFGKPVALVKGNRENIKITTPFDLKIAEALLF